MSEERYIGFGERLGYRPPFACGLKDAPGHLRNAVWNLVHPKLKSSTGRSSTVYPVTPFLRAMARDKHWDAHMLTSALPLKQLEYVRRFILHDADWHEVYELVESSPRWGTLIQQAEWVTKSNSVLLSAGSPYRMSAAGQLAPVVSAEELGAIDDAANTNGRYVAAAEHIRQATSLFGGRPDADYDNACKEAASAVESALKVATAESKTGAASRAFAQQYGTHTALMESANNLFGYASDRDGVRHGAKGTGKPVDFEEAKLVLVSASAWVNYIAARAP